MDRLITTLIEEFHSELSAFDGSVKRQANFPDLPNKIMVAIGMRRTGKTYFLFQKIKSLIKANIPLTSILYVNFEDDRLFDLDFQLTRFQLGADVVDSDRVKFASGTLINRNVLSTILDSFYSLYPENHDRKTYLFLDEIQNVKDWQIVVRRFFDKKNVQIFLTGSSAKLLSKEIATSLRGRSISIEIWPYNFTEYLSAQKISLPTKPRSQKALDQLRKIFLTYLETGGFPEVVHLDFMDRNRLLREYVDVVIFRDIVERHKITNIVLVKYLIRTLIKNAGCTISIDKVFKDLKSQGFQVAKSTLYNYLNFIEDTYLAVTVPIYSESIRKIQNNPRKIYIVDSGVSYTFALNAGDSGHLLENLVYLDLRRSGHEIYYYKTKTGKEVDFFVKCLDGSKLLYQVTWRLGDDNYYRELNALQEAEQELGIKGKLITLDSYLTEMV